MTPELTKFRTFVRQVEWNVGRHISLHHIRTGLAYKPHAMTSLIDELFATKLPAYAPLTDMLRMVGAVKRQTIPGYEWTWQAKQRGRGYAILLDARYSGSQPGVAGSEITLKFDRRMFGLNDVISPGQLSTDNLVYIVSEGIKEGEGYVYRAVLFDDDDSRYIDPNLLKAGTRWNKLYTVVGEASDGGYSYLEGAKAMFRNNMTIIRKKYSVTGSAFDNQRLVDEVLFLDSTGKKSWAFILAVERAYWQQFIRDELEAALWFSKKITGRVDANGQPIISGAGLLEQIRDAYTMHYNVLTPEILREFVYEAVANKIPPDERASRVITMFAGEVAMERFHKAVEDLLAKQNWIITGGTGFNPVQKTKSQYHSNAYSYGYQFTDVKLYNGINLRVVHNKLFDDIRFTRQIDPTTGKPVSSGWFVIFDISYGAANNNILIVEPQQPLAIGYKIGLIGPDGRVKYDNIAHTGDYYEVAMQRVAGIQVTDPTRIAWLKPYVV